MPIPDPRSTLNAALARRQALLADPQTTVARLLDGAADGVPGLVLEKLGDVLIAQIHEGRIALDDAAAQELAAAAAHEVGARAVYRKVFPRDRSRARPDLDRLHRDPQPWIGAPVEPELAVRESGLTYLVRPYDGYATGLYLDHRTQRQRVRELAHGRRVLNAFAYTCGFTVACAAGGAVHVASVDASRRYLEWGRRNLAANGFVTEPAPERPARFWFYCSDTLAFFRRARRQGQRFDLMILDPPTFGRAARGSRAFAIESDLDRLLRDALDLLAPGGTIHLSANRRGTDAGRLRAAVNHAAESAGRSCDFRPVPAPPLDFPGEPRQPSLVLAAVT